VQTVSDYLQRQGKSALGQKQTSLRLDVSSALPLKADIRELHSRGKLCASGGTVP
jgi:hypothetical protein